jgi:hypothetical protein
LKRFALTAAAACAGALALAAPAGAMVQIDRGIAGARIGNTQKQVRAALGKPDARRTGSNDFGAFVEYRYAGGLTVLFAAGAKHVTQVSTTGRGDRTASGAGVGTRETVLRKRVPGLRCETIAGARSCHTGAFEPGQRVTDFRITRGRVTRIVVSVVID